MIDIHCHLLPGIDDGPEAMDEALTLAAALYSQGVTAVAATPHVSYAFPNSRADIVQAADALRVRLAEEGIPLEVVAAAELSASAALDLDPEALEAHSLGGRYLLVEPPREGGMDALQTVASAVFAAGLTPVIAHPERMAEVRRDGDCLSALRSEGVIFQVTAASLVGRERGLRDAAWGLVDSGLATVVATDSHGSSRRPPMLASAREALVSWMGITWAEHLTDTVPAALMLGRESPMDPMEREPTRLPRRRFRFRDPGASRG